MNLQEKLSQLRSQLDDERTKPEINVDLVNLLTNQISELEYKIAQETEQEQERIQQHEQRLTEVIVGFDNVVDQMDFGGLTLRQVIGDDEVYSVIKVEFKRYIQAQADKDSQQILALQKELTEQRRAADDRELQLQRQNESLQATLANTRQQLFDATQQLQDSNNRIDAAAKELDEAQVKIKQLEGWNEDLHRQIANGVRGELKVIDTAEEEAKKKELADKLRKERTVYNVRWKDEIKRTAYLANLALTGEEIEFPWTKKAAYFEIPETEVSQFRGQYATEPSAEVPPVAEEPVQDSVEQESSFPGPITTPAIPTVTPPAVYEPISGVPGEPSTGAVVSKTLEQRVAELEQAVFGKAQGEVA
jgi:DNA repair exonuclease SbcCD ATPase subunit